MSDNKVPAMLTLTINVYPDGEIALDMSVNRALDNDKIVSEVALAAVDKAIPMLVKLGETPPKPFAEA